MANPKTDPWWHHAPPVCEALLPIDPIRGQNNLNDVWEGEVLLLDSPMAGAVRRCVFKHHNHPGKLPVELACSTVAAALGNDVPAPCLVRARSADLPDLPQHLLETDELLLFGCSYLTQDSFFEQLATSQDSTLDGAVWNSFCSDAPMAAKAAALDELIANWDRHSRNMRFDGKKWWLFDHDNSLLQTRGQDIGAMDATFKGHKNLVAGELLQRRPNDHKMPDAARLAAEKRQLVQTVGTRATFAWAHDDPKVMTLWRKTAALIDLLIRRLPMLQEMLGARIGSTTPTSLQWTPSANPPPKPT